MRARRRYLLAGIIVLQLAHPWFTAEWLIALPNLVTQALVETPIGVIAPVLVVALVQVALDTDRIDQHACAVVRFHYLDTSLILVVATVGIASGMMNE